MTDLGESARADHARRKAYWKSNLRLLAILFIIWFLVSLGAGVLFADSLNGIDFFGFPLGFWFAQQGSIIVFVILIAVYAILVSRLDRRYGYDRPTEEDDA
jgi:putative solute:sodium symporter small subunit